MKTILLVIVALALSGCATSYNLPAITAKEFEYNRTDPAGGTQVKAKNVRVEDDRVKADEASWNTTYPAFSLRVSVKGYERIKGKDDTQ